MTKLQRELVSRATMIVLGLALLFGSYKCFQATQYIYEHPAHPEAPAYGRRYDDVGFPLVLAYALLIAGGLLVLGGIAPTRLIERIIRPPKLTLWENPSADNPRGLWR